MRYSPVQGFIVANIAIVNKGRGAANNCKGYIAFNGFVYRISWFTPSERPKALINSLGFEALEICAFSTNSINKVIVPNENGFVDIQITPYVEIPPEINKCTVLVTADNSKPLKFEVELDRDKKKINITKIYIETSCLNK